MDGRSQNAIFAIWDNISQDNLYCKVALGRSTITVIVNKTPDKNKIVNKKKQSGLQIKHNMINKIHSKLTSFSKYFCKYLQTNAAFLNELFWPGTQIPTRGL